ncbi:MAG: hypothetical protein RBU45_16225 [Myxococcota bacterium]|jgi:hypothetical protein|nr:hypothetical protein [Myxococcota bacterium]
MKRFVSTFVYGGLLLVGLTLAYLGWTRAPEPPRPGALVWDLGQLGAIQEVRLERPAGTIALRPAAAETGPVWVRVTTPVAPPIPSPAGTPEASPAASPASAPARTEEFVGTPRAREIVTELVRLAGKRALGELPAPKLAELGLAEPQETLTVVTAAGERRLALGGTVLGSGLRYAQELGPGGVYVLEPRLLQDLSGAPVRLLQRDLQPFAPTDFDGVEVLFAGRSQAFARNPDSTLQWTRAGSAEVVAPAGPLLAKSTRLKAVRYLPASETPAGEPLVELRYLKGTEPLGFLRVFAGEVGAGGQPRLLGVSGLTAGRAVELTSPLAAELVTDLAAWWEVPSPLAPPAAALPPPAPLLPAPSSSTEP